MIVFISSNSSNIDTSTWSNNSNQTKTYERFTNVANDLHQMNELTQQYPHNVTNIPISFMIFINNIINYILQWFLVLLLLVVFIRILIYLRKIQNLIIQCKQDHQQKSNHSHNNNDSLNFQDLNLNREMVSKI